jgi:hypothetical protein
MDFGSVPGCGVAKDKSGLKGADAGVEFITEWRSREVASHSLE